MKNDVEENLIEVNQRNSFVVEDEINEFLDKDEGKNIKADIELLNNMGFDKKMINKVYILLRPENIERAIDYMTEIDGIYQHDFVSSSNPNEKSLCFICKKPKNNHLDYIPNDLLIDVELDNNHININQINNDINIDNDENYYECEVCYEQIEDKKLNTIPCGHLFCTHCWFNYLKTLISEAKVEKIKCMNHECNENISEEFILEHISDNNDLIEKYKKFKKRVEILQDKNKKLCPNPDCDSFLQKSEQTKYVKCEYGHEYCFDCLRPPHGDESCDDNLEKQLVNWTKGKRVKRCPRCKIYTEKNEGCNHMTCVSCKYQWCWLCEGEYKYGHYDSGKCQGQQFAKADYPKEIINDNNNYNNNINVNVNNQNNNEDRNNSGICNFGLHKIFRCVYPDRVLPFYYLNNEAPKFIYLLIIGFWLFGVLVNFIFIFEYNVDKNFVKPKTCAEKTRFVFEFLTGLALTVSFQITFTCLITPFILICFIYPRFFVIFIAFFGIGEP